jgi:acyl carrier protein
MTLSPQISLSQQVIAWIRTVKPGVSTNDVQSSDLIQSRILDSMQFLDFVYYLNELCGIDVTSVITIDDMRTVQKIVAFVEQHGEAQPSQLRLAS